MYGLRRRIVGSIIIGLLTISFLGEGNLSYANRHTKDLTTKMIVKEGIVKKEYIRITERVTQEITQEVTDNPGNEKCVPEETQEIKKESEEIKEIEPLIYINNLDTEYKGRPYDVGNERELLERIVMGEAGAEGFNGAALVAQCIRDTLIYKGAGSVREVITKYKYSGDTSKIPNDDVKAAVSYIFDQGGVAVKHKIFYFYAPKLVNSSFHESRKFIVEYGGHRFFE